MHIDIYAHTFNLYFKLLLFCYIFSNPFFLCFSQISFYASYNVSISGFIYLT